MDPNRARGGENRGESNSNNSGRGLQGGNNPNNDAGISVGQSPPSSARGSVWASNSGGVLNCPDSFGPDSVEKVGTTEVKLETFSFHWTINGFAALSRNVADKIESPIFHGNLSNHSWQLRIVPKNKNLIDGQEYLSGYFVLVDFGDHWSPPNRKLKVRVKFSLLDVDGCPRLQRGSVARSDYGWVMRGAHHGFDKFILSSELTSPSRQLMQDGSLRIFVEFLVDYDEHKVWDGGAIRKTLPEEERVKRHRDRLAKDFGKLFKDSLMTDITIITDNGTIMAHKAVLAGRSSVFTANLNSNAMEEGKNVLEIPGFEHKVVKGFLEYLYTGETTLLNRHSPELLEMSDKYDMPELKEACEQRLEESLDENTAPHILVLADRSNANRLKSRVMEYINCNKKEIARTAGFQKVAKSCPDLFVDLYLSQ